MRWRGTVPVSLGSRSEAEEQGTPAPPKEKQTPVQQELVASNHFANQPSLARVAHKHTFKSKSSGPSGSLKSLSNPEEVKEDQTYCQQARLAITDAGIGDRPLPGIPALTTDFATHTPFPFRGQVTATPPVVQAGPANPYPYA